MHVPYKKGSLLFSYNLKAWKLGTIRGHGRNEVSRTSPTFLHFILFPRFVPGECDLQETTESEDPLIGPHVGRQINVGVHFSHRPIRPRLHRPEEDHITQGTKDLLSQNWTIGRQRLVLHRSVVDHPRALPRAILDSSLGTCGPMSGPLVATIPTLLGYKNIFLSTRRRFPFREVGASDTLFFAEK